MKIASTECDSPYVCWDIAMVDILISWLILINSSLYYMCVGLLIKSTSISINRLVGGIPTPLKNISSVGMMTFPIYGKIKFMFQTTNQMIMDDNGWFGADPMDSKPPLINMNQPTAPNGPAAFCKTSAPDVPSGLPWTNPAVGRWSHLSLRSRPGKFPSKNRATECVYIYIIYLIMVIIIILIIIQYISLLLLLLLCVSIIIVVIITILYCIIIILL